MKRAAPESSLNRASRSVAVGLDDVLLAHATAAAAAHVIAETLIRSRDELPEHEYERLLNHTGGVLSELYAARLAEDAA